MERGYVYQPYLREGDVMVDPKDQKFIDRLNRKRTIVGVVFPLGVFPRVSNPRDRLFVIDSL